MVVLSMRMTSHGENLQDRLSRINERLDKHQGEFVLLVENREESLIKDAPPGPHDYCIVTNLYIGIINGDALVELNGFGHAIPTDRYTFCRLFYDHSRVSTYQGNLSPSLKFLLFHLDLPLEAKNPLSVMLTKAHGKKLVDLELHIGNEEISAWAGDDEHKLLVLKAMAKPLGRPLPQAVQPKLKAAIAEQRQAALQEIARLLDQYFALLREIRAQGKPKDVTVPSLSVFDDQEILIDAKEAAFFGPLGAMNEQLDELKRDIRLTLADARQLGLSNKIIVAVLAGQYQKVLTALLDHISKSGRKKKAS